MKIRRLPVIGVSLVMSMSLLSFMVASLEPTYSIEELRALYSSGDPAKWPAPFLDSAVRIGFQDIGKLGTAPYPVYNPYTKEKEALGKTLFYDPRLSQSKQVACASCHDPELGWGDGRRVSYGHNRQTGKRNAMSLFNIGHFTAFFWDGRAATLEEQSVFPVQDKVEMAQTLTAMVTNVQAVEAYKPLFVAAFGNDEVSVQKIQYAIATFERGIASNSSRFDAFVSGHPKAMTDEEVQGLHLFRTKARCINCHNTPLFSDNQFHNDGQALYGSKMEDFGRYHLTKKQVDIGAFRTPSLREVGQTGPWMHHGNFPTLRDVVEYYNNGNPAPIQRFVKVDESMRPIPSAILRKLDLSTDEVKAVEAFLRTLTTPVRKPFPPELPGMQ
ncbi:cytochrome c peroxidase [Chitinophaga skermanii]|uniref:Methylamine utilization protein MauG n=1 Tax=Chitinophaga skermanii TaxID=331697 RepID=A0A327QLK6_9BACT|nr:cytochrome c peroxidase [Chitinophaga skermanii]RAJ05190.1 cytochrome c peroxidase [Chitinophaga skermanii]